MAKVGIIGGSGLYAIEGLEDLKRVDMLNTPFGPPSDHSMTGVLDGVEVVFIPRHGEGHRISPSEINYRANIYEMKRLGVDAIISVSAVGSLKENIKPMDFVVPDQFVDRTNRGREASFFTDGIVAHVGMADPVASELTDILVSSAQEAGVPVHEKGTYVNMEGPQFSTRAESQLFRSWGMSIIGMTNMIEAKLAREAEISYATLAAVTDYDCWHEDHETVTIEMILGYLNKNVDNAKQILKCAIPRIGALKEFSAQDALKCAIVTQEDHISEQKRSDLRIFLEKYISYDK
jgi:5'-methylthioadenosine phosphorylase